MSGQPCPACGTPEYRPATRFEVAGRNVAVTCCFACGYDDKPMYPRRRAGASRPVVVLGSRACAHCGAVFALRATQVCQRYCTAACQRAAKVAREATVRKRELGTRPCRLCGRAFTVRAGRPAQLYCGPRCALTAIHQRAAGRTA